MPADPSPLFSGYLGLARRLAAAHAARFRLRADDAEADALLGLWQASRRCPEGVDFAPFAATVIRRRLIDALRRERFRRRLVKAVPFSVLARALERRDVAGRSQGNCRCSAAVVDPADAEDRLAALCGEEQFEELLAWSSFNGRRKVTGARLLRLMHRDGMSLAEAARALKLNESTARGRAAAALGCLREGFASLGVKG